MAHEIVRYSRTHHPTSWGTGLPFFISNRWYARGGPNLSRRASRHVRASLSRGGSPTITSLSMSGPDRRPIRILHQLTEGLSDTATGRETGPYLIVGVTAVLLHRNIDEGPVSSILLTAHVVPAMHPLEVREQRFLKGIVTLRHINVFLGSVVAEAGGAGLVARQPLEVPRPFLPARSRGLSLPQRIRRGAVADRNHRAPLQR